MYNACFYFDKLLDGGGGYGGGGGGGKGGGGKIFTNFETFYSVLTRNFATPDGVFNKWEYLLGGAYGGGGGGDFGGGGSYGGGGGGGGGKGTKNHVSVDA